MKIIGNCHYLAVMRMTAISALLLALAAFTAPASAAARLDWITTVVADGSHNAFTDLAAWQGHYYLCFRHGAGHLSMDGEIRIMRSADLKTWEPAGTVDTLGDDRDPHFAISDKGLHVFFGTWDLTHVDGPGLPGRGRLRSYMATTTDGAAWRDVTGLYEADWWLWRARWHDGAFYSVAYTLKWPSTPRGEARLLRSENGADWISVATCATERMPDEADWLVRPDGSLVSVIRTCDSAGDAMLLQSDPARTQWTQKNLGVAVHSPAMVEWKGRIFVAGRGREGDALSTRLWELKGETLHELFVLPSGGDTAYPGLLIDPATTDSNAPAFFISWYSQHEKRPETPDQANVYVGRIVLEP